MTDSEQSFDELTVGTLSSESDEDVEGEPESDIDDSEDEQDEPSSSTPSPSSPDAHRSSTLRHFAELEDDEEPLPSNPIFQC